MLTDESSLIERSQRGDLAAFDLLVECYQRQVYNLCLRLLASAPSAEDVTQEAFIAAYRRIDTFRGGNFRAWLLRIAANASYDELRRQRRRPAASLEATMSTPGASQAPSPAAGPEDEALRLELNVHLQEGLAALPADQRLAVILRDVQGLSYEEVAEVMRSSVGTVKSRIARGRARMREYLLARRELLPDPFRLMD